MLGSFIIVFFSQLRDEYRGGACSNISVNCTVARNTVMYGAVGVWLTLFDRVDSGVQLQGQRPTRSRSAAKR